jgi:magnesium chelatase accessory protein
MRMGQGPVCLLLHGTGASIHSFRDLAPALARHFTVIAPDLPGHGFTDGAPAAQRSLPGMAAALSELLRETGAPPPAFAIGHSAGAAILSRMTIDGEITPRGIMALNGAFLSFRGAVGQFFSPLAKMLVLNPLTPSLFAWHAGQRRVTDRLIGETGSHLDERGLGLYSRLAGDRGHVAGALGMMASWDLAPLERDLKRLPVPLYLVAAANDRTVPPEQAAQVRRLASDARVIRVAGLGHLAHEEKPVDIAALAFDLARRCGALPAEQTDAQPDAG